MASEKKIGSSIQPTPKQSSGCLHNGTGGTLSLVRSSIKILLRTTKLTLKTIGLASIISLIVKLINHRRYKQTRQEYQPQKETKQIEAEKTYISTVSFSERLVDAEKESVLEDCDSKSSQCTFSQASECEITDLATFTQSLVSLNKPFENSEDSERERLSLLLIGLLNSLDQDYTPGPEKMAIFSELEWLATCLSHSVPFCPTRRLNYAQHENSLSESHTLSLSNWDLDLSSVYEELNVRESSILRRSFRRTAGQDRIALLLATQEVFQSSRISTFQRCNHSNINTDMQLTATENAVFRWKQMEQHIRDGLPWISPETVAQISVLAVRWIRKMLSCSRPWDVLPNSQNFHKLGYVLAQKFICIDNATECSPDGLVLSLCGVHDRAFMAALSLHFALQAWQSPNMSSVEDLDHENAQEQPTSYFVIEALYRFLNAASRNNMQINKLQSYLERGNFSINASGYAALPLWLHWCVPNWDMEFLDPLNAVIGFESLVLKYVCELDETDCVLSSIGQEYSEEKSRETQEFVGQKEHDLIERVIFHSVCDPLTPESIHGMTNCLSYADALALLPVAALSGQWRLFVSLSDRLMGRRRIGDKDHYVCVGEDFELPIKAPTTFKFEKQIKHKSLHRKRYNPWLMEQFHFAATDNPFKETIDYSVLDSLTRFVIEHPCFSPRTSLSSLSYLESRFPPNHSVDHSSAQLGASHADSTKSTPHTNFVDSNLSVDPQMCSKVCSLLHSEAYRAIKVRYKLLSMLVSDREMAKEKLESVTGDDWIEDTLTEDEAPWLWSRGSIGCWQSPDLSSDMALSGLISDSELLFSGYQHKFLSSDMPTCDSNQIDPSLVVPMEYMQDYLEEKIKIESEHSFHGSLDKKHQRHLHKEKGYPKKLVHYTQILDLHKNCKLAKQDIYKEKENEEPDMHSDSHLPSHSGFSLESIDSEPKGWDLRGHWSGVCQIITSPMDIEQATRKWKPELGFAPLIRSQEIFHLLEEVYHDDTDSINSNCTWMNENTIESDGPKTDEEFLSIPIDKEFVLFFAIDLELEYIPNANVNWDAIFHQSNSVSSGVCPEEPIEESSYESKSQIEDLDAQKYYDDVMYSWLQKD